VGRDQWASFPRRERGRRIYLVRSCRPLNAFAFLRRVRSCDNDLTYLINSIFTTLLDEAQLALFLRY
jgi:hypothetical protein